MWTYATDKALVKHFEGVNIFNSARKEIGSTKVLDPTYGNELIARVFEVEINGRRKEFATAEACSSVFIYFIPSQQDS
jgi:hypothetical protein